MTVGICGLGLIGGSMAKAYRESGHTVLGADINEATLGYCELAGIINGFVGTGGGIILIFLFYLLRSGDEGDFKNDLVTTDAAVIPMSAVALFLYARGSNVDFYIIGRLFIPIALGGVTGAYLMSRIDKKWLTVIFSALMIYSGIRMAVSVL